MGIRVNWKGLKQSASFFLAILIVWPIAIAAKLILVVLGLLVVPVSIFILKTDPPKPWNGPPVGNIPQWKNLMIRNPVSGFGLIFRHPVTRTTTFGEIREPHTTDSKFQFRLKHNGLFCSIRMLWKYSRTRYGELYVGWKLDSEPPLLDFALSLRPWATVGN